MNEDENLQQGYQDYDYQAEEYLQLKDKLYQLINEHSIESVFSVLRDINDSFIQSAKRKENIDEECPF